MGFVIPERYAGHAFIFLCTIFARLKTKWKDVHLRKESRDPDFLENLHTNVTRYEHHTTRELAEEFEVQFCIRENKVYKKPIGEGFKLYLSLEKKKMILCDPLLFYFIGFPFYLYEFLGE